MALLLLPFFLPLMLIGWMFPPDDEREIEAQEAERERQFGQTWALLYGRESEVLELDAAE